MDRTIGVRDYLENIRLRSSETKRAVFCTMSLSLCKVCLLSFEQPKQVDKFLSSCI